MKRSKSVKQVKVYALFGYRKGGRKIVFLGTFVSSNVRSSLAVFRRKNPNLEITSAREMPLPVIKEDTIRRRKASRQDATTRFGNLVDWLVGGGGSAAT